MKLKMGDNLLFKLLKMEKYKKIKSREYEAIKDPLPENLGRILNIAISDPKWTSIETPKTMHTSIY